jgi:hypothetical protein
MRLSRPFCRHPGWVIALGTIVVVVYGLSILWDAMKPGCTSVVLDRLPSPDGAWVAVSEEFTCEMGFSMSDIAVGVRLVATKPPLQDVHLIGVDTGGNEDERPRAAWLAPNVLRITVPLNSLLHILTRQAGGVRVDIHFDPDDPAARADWLKQTGQAPDPADGTKPQ